MQEKHADKKQQQTSIEHLLRKSVDSSQVVFSSIELYHSAEPELKELMSTIIKEEYPRINDLLTLTMQKRFEDPREKGVYSTMDKLVATAAVELVLASPVYIGMLREDLKESNPSHLLPLWFNEWTAQNMKNGAYNAMVVTKNIGDMFNNGSIVELNNAVYKVGSKRRVLKVLGKDEAEIDNIIYAENLRINITKAISNDETYTPGFKIKEMLSIVRNSEKESRIPTKTLIDKDLEERYIYYIN